PEQVPEYSQKGNFKVVSGNNDHYIYYTLSLSELTLSSNLQVADFKWELLKDNNSHASGTFNGVSQNSMTLASDIVIGANETANYELRLWIEESGGDQYYLIGGTFVGKINMVADMEQDPIPPLLRTKILEQEGGVLAIEAKEEPDFSKIAVSQATYDALPETSYFVFPPSKEKATVEIGLYAAEDEYGTSYYYRGEKTELNNNLIWGGFQWKIVRINGDGSVRLIYNGTEAQFNINRTVNDTGENTQIEGTYTWNEINKNDAKYVGYMYGGDNGSPSTSRHGSISTAATFNQTNTNIKTILDNWYKTNIFDQGFGSQVADNLFCNDRQLRSDPGVGGEATGPGYGTSTTYYAADYRLEPNYTPTLKCGLQNDQFTTSAGAEIGNGALEYPVGLLTVDEASMAGLTGGTNNDTNYLYTNQTWWSFSPSYMLSSGPACVYFVYSSGYLHTNSVDIADGARPSLSISPTVRVTGSGSATDPFVAI
ncbi:MAG: hypothetical protein PHP12_05930, partial [Bacilli bacterium]|nr:hypothetical protein [Bacilli bacterium]